MQGTIFAGILQMSLVGSYSIGVVLAVRLLLKRCGSVYAYYLWVLMFVGLCLPVSVPWHYSLIPGPVAEFSLTETMRQEEPLEGPDGQETVLQTPDDGQGRSAALHRLPPPELSSGQLQNAAEETEAAEQAHVFDEKDGRESGWKETNGQRSKGAVMDWRACLAAAEKVWLLGIFFLTLYSLSALYQMSRRCSRYGRPDRKDGNGIVEAEDVPSPFLWGLFRPVIYLPSGLNKEEKTYILAHEKVHKKRGDHLVKPLLLMVTIMHWFNPLVWTAYALCCKDMETSCDEAVLETCGKGIRKAYAESLLKYAARQNRFILSPLGFGEPSVKSRILNVLRFRKKNIWICAAAVVCVIGVAAGLFSRPAKDRMLPEEPVLEAEPLQEGEEPEKDAEEGLVENNGGEVICVAEEYYYMDGKPLYSDGEAIYTSVLDDDGQWRVCRYETDGSGYRRIFEGRIVDSTESGQVLYCMFPSKSGGECLGWYDTQAEQSGRFSKEGVSYLGKYAGYVYTSRQEPDGLHVDRVREMDLAEMPDLMKEGIPAKEILAFYADEGSSRLVFAAETSKEEEGGSKILCYSYEVGSGKLASKELTGLPYFAMMDGYLYFQRYRSREDLTPELFRTDFEFAGEEQVGEGLTLLCTDEETHTLLAEKKTEHPEFGPVNSLVRILPDEKKEQMLLNMETMLPAAGDEDRFVVDEVCLDWEFQNGDGVAYSELNLFREMVYVTVSHMPGQSPDSGGQTDIPLEEVHLTVSGQGGIGVWFPDRLTPGWEDDSWHTDSIVGQPVGMEAAGWDVEHAVDVREDFQKLPMAPEASERRKTYLLGETRYWTLYGKGDYQSMLLERNGRYTEIHYPYMSGRRVRPELMEADLDRDGITELAICFNIRNGTGSSMDTLLTADFENNGTWVYQFLDEDFEEQLGVHITGEWTERGLQTDFCFDETGEKILIRAELEFQDEDAPGTDGYNDGAITADVIWSDHQFHIKNIRKAEYSCLTP